MLGAVEPDEREGQYMMAEGGPHASGRALRVSERDGDAVSVEVTIGEDLTSYDEREVGVGIGTGGAQSQLVMEGATLHDRSQLKTDGIIVAPPLEGHGLVVAIDSATMTATEQRQAHEQHQEEKDAMAASAHYVGHCDATGGPDGQKTYASSFSS